MARSLEEISAAIPPVPGSYALHLSLISPVVTRIGRLGEVEFQPGDYLYLGSAMGPGGLRARIAHHLRPALKPHWHIDWLRQHASVRAVWFSSGPVSMECTWSQAVLGMRGVSCTARGFGASDCQAGCPSHLVCFSGALDCAEIRRVLQTSAAMLDYILVYD